MACGLLTAGFALDCANPIVAGVEEQLILINYEDWVDATITNDGTDDIGIVSIALQTGVLAYSIEGYRNTLRPRYERSVENGLTRYKHTLDFQIAGDDVTAKRLVQKLGLGTYVAIAFTKSGQVEVYGAGTGLVVQDGTGRDRYVSNAVATLALASDDESLEVKVPSNFVGTATTYSFAAAKAEVEALLS